MIDRRQLLIGDAASGVLACTRGPVTRSRVPCAPPPGTGNFGPWSGLQSFGTIDVSRDALHVELVGIDGKPRFALDLPHAG